MDENEKNYNDRLKTYTTTFKLACKISQLVAGRRANDRMVWASALFTKLCTTGTSIFILAPDSDIAIKMIPFWDYSSQFTLARNIIECYQTLFYLCVDKISDDEYAARQLLFHLHDYSERQKLAEFGNYENRDEEVASTIRARLSETKYFQSLELKQQQHYLKGNHAFFLNKEQIEERIGNSISYFRLIYKLFSSTAHSLPMGFYGMYEGERGRGIQSEVEMGYNALVLEIVEQYLRIASINITDLFPDVLEGLSETEKKHLLKTEG